MHANLYATFRMIAGEKTIEITPRGGMTVREAVEEILRACPTLRKHWVNDKGELHAHVHIFLNSVDVMTLPRKLGSPVGAEDTLDFFPPVAGG